MQISDADLQAAKQALRIARKSAAAVEPEFLAKRLKWTVKKSAAVIEALKNEPKPEKPKPEPKPQKPERGEEHERTQDKWSISIPKTRIHTLEELLAYCEVNQAEWEVERFIVNKWEVGAKDATQEVQIHPLFQVKAVLRRKVAVISAREEIDAMLAELRSKAPIYPRIKPASKTTGNLLELSLPDAHLGKLAWAQETGWENYDSRIAEQVFTDAFSALLQRTSAYQFDRVLLVPGNDYLNANNSENTTAGGTPQNCDGRHKKTFRLACKLTSWTIERALEIAEFVDVLPIEGNHDPDAIFYLAEVLAAKFAREPRVKIDDGPTKRKFYHWGNVALMFTHGVGGKKKRDDMPLLMATERRKMWGDSKYCEIHTGDKHQVRLEEQFGVRVRILPSLCPPDYWHSSEGYVGNIRSAEAYIWNRDEGLIGTATYTVPDQGPRVA